jgi:hypothetical protein
MYERATKDFYDGVTGPALLGSRYLIVVATPDAVDRGAGKTDWMRREIGDFEAGPNAGNLIVVLAKGSMDGPLPGDIRQRYPNAEIIDLRGLGAFSFLNPLKAARITDEIVKLAAPLLQITSDEMPILRREEERRQQVRLGLAAGSATAMVLAVAALSVWALYSRNNALDAISRSVFATDRVIQSVARSMAASETRSNILARSCDLLDSLTSGSTDEPRTNALVLCAVARSESRDQQGESKEATQILRDAISLAERQYERLKGADDAAALLEARRAVMVRSVAASSVAEDLKAFIEVTRRLTRELRSDRSLPRSAADALQIHAVSLTEKKLLQPAMTAVNAAVEFRSRAIEQDAGPSQVIEAAKAIIFKAHLHKLSRELGESSRAIERARVILTGIKRDVVSKEGLDEQYAQVTKLFAAEVAWKP